jgi:replicative DNA helicase
MGAIELIIGKQRNGPVGRDIGLKFRKQWGSFIDA